MASWDGVPLEVDVTLPATGPGPFPTLVALGRPADAIYARRGYAVVSLSPRGYRRSCGVADSRTPDCARGWTHLADQRYEARDVQHLLGLLVDQGIAAPQALGVSGDADNGVVALELAALRNRVRLPDGALVPWRSPAGRRLAIAAAFAARPADDLTTTLLPDGRFLDYAAAKPAGTGPLGVARLAAVDSLLGPDAFVAPAGADAGADLRGWRRTIEAGEPYGAAARRMARELTRYHSPAGLTGTPAPILLQAAWADTVFAPAEPLRFYNRLRARNPRAQVTLSLVRSGDEPGAAARATRFLDAWLRRRGTPPGAGSVLAYLQAPAGPSVAATSWAALHPGALRLATSRPQSVSSDPALATTVLERPVARGFTLLGRPTVTLRLRATGAAGQLDSRLWDVDPGAGIQTLVTRGAYRLTAGQRGDVALQLDGAAYRFAPGHRVKLELAGRDPDALRPSDGGFAATLSRLAVELPVRERPSRARGILRPRFATDPALG